MLDICQFPTYAFIRKFLAYTILKKCGGVRFGIKSDNMIKSEKKTKISIEFRDKEAIFIVKYFLLPKWADYSKIFSTT